MSKTVKIAILGAGTVGKGVYRLLTKQQEEMCRKTGCDVEIASILVRDLSKERADIEKSLLTDQWPAILENQEIEIIIEVMGGIEPARTMILEAINAGKHVVTANKDLIAEHGGELLDVAQKKGVDFLFEASVAGGIPIIRPFKQCLAGNHIREIVGIVNGTTNFILTKMFEEHMDFQEALAIATKLGYAESDPTADIEGLDAGRKMAILSSIGFHSPVAFQDVYIEGITKVTARDVKDTEELGFTIKLLGMAKDTREGIEVGVFPALIDKSHPLAAVRDSFNAIFVNADALGDAMFYGRGAGELPTASAVLGDLIDVVRDIHHHCPGRIHCTCYKRLPFKPIEKQKSKFFLRLTAEGGVDVLAAMTGIFATHKIGIEKMIQHTNEGEDVEVILITDEICCGALEKALKKLREQKSIREIHSVIRVYC